MEILNIYCDGSCDNKYRGAWAIACPSDNYTRVGTDSETTNNRMEQLAMCHALDYAIDRACGGYPDLGKPKVVHIHSDSKYVTRGINEWFNAWSINQFRGIENSDLWLMIASRIKQIQDLRIQVLVKWVKGHADDEGNNTVDKLAVEARKKQFN